jgi:hypothetical protein
MGADRSPLRVLWRVQILTILLLTLFIQSAAGAPSLTASSSDAAPPGELAPAISARLAPGSSKVQAGPAALEFWWVKSLERTGDGEGWSGVPEGALAGAVLVSGPYPDIRGRRIKPGVYTLRFALQPMNGDHLGVSPHREFLLVSPASADTNPAPAGYQGAVDLSKQTTGASHPAAWSIDPPTTADEPLRSFTNDSGHHGVVFRAGTLRFGVILVGKIEA